MPPNFWTLATLADELDSGRTTSRELVGECLARISDPAGEGRRAFVHVDNEAALASSDAMDRLRKINVAPSRYAGIPISIKDLFDITGRIHRQNAHGRT